MVMVWLTELQKHCQYQQVIAIFSLPKQGRYFFLLHFVVDTVSSELRPSGAVMLSGLGKW
jgi:hypothetical protein